MFVLVCVCVCILSLLLAKCCTRTDASCIGHQMWQQILLHNAAKEMRLWTLRKDGHILARMDALAMYIAGREGG